MKVYKRKSDGAVGAVLRRHTGCALFIGDEVHNLPTGDWQEMEVPECERRNCVPADPPPIPKLPPKLKPGDAIEAGENYICRHMQNGKWHQVTNMSRWDLSELTCKQNDYYRDPRPFPVPPEPPKIEPPKWEGVVRSNTLGKHMLVTEIYDGSLSGINSSGAVYVNKSPESWTLIDHPDYPPSDELRALFEGRESE